MAKNDLVTVVMERDQWNAIALGLKDLADNIENHTIKVDGTQEDVNDLVVANRQLSEEICRQASV